MAREPYTVNGLSFKTKQELREHIRSIRDCYGDGVIIADEHFDFMLDLLNRHESADIKIGCGVAYMYVKTNEVFKRNREFWLVRTDGSETDFSYEICLKHETKLQKFKSACRTAVAPYVMEFKIRFFTAADGVAICPITSERMTLRDNAHVDHEPPNTFDKIVSDFIQIRGLDVEEIDLITAEDGRVRNEIASKVIEADFIRFHNEQANLRVVSKRANLSIVKKANDD